MRHEDHDGPSAPHSLRALALVRERALALPGAEERVSHGEPAWFVGRRLFATFAGHHHDDRVAVWLAAPLGAQETLVDEDPDRFFRPPYVGVRGWVGVYLDVPQVDGDELAELIEDAWRLCAPKRLVAEFDGR